MNSMSSDWHGRALRDQWDKHNNRARMVFASSVLMTAFCGLVGCRCGLLRGPVVDVPVIFVEEEIVLLEKLRGHGRELGVGEGAHKKIALKCSALTTLVWQLLARMRVNEIHVKLLAWKGVAGSVGQT